MIYQERQGISIHALLAESDARRESRQQPAGISIHALLAESDHTGVSTIFPACYFYPRSPCGERHRGRYSQHQHEQNFYPRSPCGERPPPFLKFPSVGDFYPRSPCGERRQAMTTGYVVGDISIHALLAESDPGAKSITPERYYFYPRSPCGERPIFAVRPYDAPIFLSTLSLRRATRGQRPNWGGCLFLSTLSLRRATGLWVIRTLQGRHFYPRSPCGERRNIG